MTKEKKNINKIPTLNKILNQKTLYRQTCFDDFEQIIYQVQYVKLVHLVKA